MSSDTPPQDELRLALVQNDDDRDLSEARDKCEPQAEELRDGTIQMDYYGENTWERLGPDIVRGAREKRPRWIRMARW